MWKSFLRSLKKAQKKKFEKRKYLDAVQKFIKCIKKIILPWKSIRRKFYRHLANVYFMFCSEIHSWKWRECSAQLFSETFFNYFSCLGTVFDSTFEMISVVPEIPVLISGHIVGIPIFLVYFLIFIFFATFLVMFNFAIWTLGDPKKYYVS